MKKQLILILALCAVAIGAEVSSGQGTFQDLDFEEARLAFVDSPTNMFIATADALPGWNAFAGTNPLSVIQYRVGGTFPPVALSGANDFIIGGNFCVFVNTSGSISQTGLIPLNTRSLLFSVGTVGQPRVFVGGSELPYSLINQGSNYSVFGADVSAFAGQNTTLRFAGPGYWLDDIQFSSQPIPEPPTVALLNLSALLLASGWFRRGRSDKP